MKKVVFGFCMAAASAAWASAFPYDADMTVRHQAESASVASYAEATAIPQVSAMPNTDSVATLVVTNMDFQAAEGTYWTDGAAAVAPAQAAIAIRNAAGRNCWMGYAGGAWVELSGADANEGMHLVKIDIDYSPGAGGRKIRYTVDGAELTAGGEPWLAIGQDGDKIAGVGMLGYGSSGAAVAKSGARPLEGVAAKVENVSMDYQKLLVDVSVTESWGVTGAKVILHDGATAVTNAGELVGGKVTADFSNVTEAGKSYTYDVVLTGGYNGSTLEPVVTHTEQPVDLFKDVEWFGFADGQFVKAAASANVAVADKAFGTAGEKGTVTPSVIAAEGAEMEMTATLNVTRPCPWADLPASAPQFAMALARDAGGYRTWAVKTGSAAWAPVSPSVLEIDQPGAFRVTRITKDANGAVASVDIAFPATNFPRKVCLAWGTSDRGDAYGDWGDTRILGTAAANATAMTVAIPNDIGAVIAHQGFRVFLGSTTARDYVQDALAVLYDCRENVGWGAFNASATTWRNLVSDDRGTDLNLNTTGTPPDYFETDNVHLAGSVYRKSTTAAVASEGDTISMEFNMKPPAGTSGESWFGLVRGLGRVGFRYGVANFMAGHPQANGKYCMRWFGSLFPTDSAYHTYTAAGFNRVGSQVRTAWSDGVKKDQTGEYGDAGATTDTTYLFQLGFDNQVSMDLRSVRVYTKKLDDADIAHNRAVDESRFGDGVPFHFEASAYTRADFIVQNGAYDVKVTADYRADEKTVTYYMKQSSSQDYYQLATGALTADKLNGVAVMGGTVSALNAAYRATSAVPVAVDESKNTIELADNQVLDLATTTQAKSYAVSRPADKAYHLAWKDAPGKYAVMSNNVLTVKDGTPANGEASYASYVLGLDAEDATSVPFIAPVQTDNPNHLTLTIPNVRPLDAKDTGVAVSYWLTTSETSGGSGEEEKVSGPRFETALPASGVRYYRISIKLAE